MILEAMYNGEFYPCETVVPTSPEYQVWLFRWADVQQEAHEQVQQKKEK